MVGVQVDKSSESKEEYDAGDVLPIFAMESIANTKDISSTVHAFAEIVNASLKSRVWENHKHGSAGGHGDETN